MQNLKRCIFILISIGSFVILNGCASTIMQPTSLVESVENDSSLVTFLLPSSLTDFGSSGQSITPVEFDLWDSMKFIGAVSKHTYVQYSAEPGEHVFMASGGNWSCVNANLEAGKKYYVIVNIYPGPWKEHVALKPIIKGSEEMEVSLPKWLANFSPMTVIPENYEAYSERRVRNITRAMNNVENGRARCGILEAQDGI